MPMEPEEQSSADGGESTAKCPNLYASSGEDLLSALPEDILILILLRLDTIAEAARTGVLSRRWRRIWTLLPWLTFRSRPDYHHIRDVLVAPVAPAPALRQIHVVTENDTPEHLAAWLPLAASRLSGGLRYCNTVTEEKEVDGSISLPCFGNVTSIKLHLGFLALALPSSGEFIRLKKLYLHRVQFQGPCELSDVISSPRCPRLRELSLRHIRGLVNLAVSSKSLVEIDLRLINGLLQLKIDAPELEFLTLDRCFLPNLPVVNVSAPQLWVLNWMDAYDPTSVELGNLGELEELSTHCFLVYDKHNNRRNRDFLRLLQQFHFIHGLSIGLIYRQEIGHSQYLMEDIKFLPNVVLLNMRVKNQGHSFGSSLFHVLRLCTGIQFLVVDLHSIRILEEAQATCASGCICDQPNNWKTEELSLNCLEEAEITDLQRVEHEVAFLKQFFKWAIVMKKFKVTFNHCVSKSKAKEFCQRLSSFSRPETVVEFCIYHNSSSRSAELPLLEDEGTGV